MFFRSPIRKIYMDTLTATRSVHTNVMRVSALDHDGCFGVPYILPEQAVIAHQHVIEQLKQRQELKHYAFHYVTSVSNRQSIEVDCNIAIQNQNNLGFLIAAEIAKGLGAYFDPLLLADITAKQKPGFTISQMKTALADSGINPNKEGLSDGFLKQLIMGAHANYCISLDKINIVYAQMQRMALMHPDIKIEFEVYDDLVDQVLTPLGTFYRMYPSLIPANVTLTLNHYDTTHAADYYQNCPNYPSVMAVMNGEGQIDADYYLTVEAMTEIAIKEEGRRPCYQMAAYLTPEKIWANRLLLEAAGQPSSRSRFQV